MKCLMVAGYPLLLVVECGLYDWKLVSSDVLDFVIWTLCFISSATAGSENYTSYYPMFITMHMRC
jgi:hypothetical protein